MDIFSIRGQTNKSNKYPSSFWFPFLVRILLCQVMVGF
jgi:hypothetical protein